MGGGTGTSRREKGNVMKNEIKKKEDKGQGLTELVFSWSIADIMNKDLYRNKVNRIPDTFLSADHYLKSFVYPLIEETHADLRSNFTTLRRAPACEVLDVKKQKEFKPPKKLFYELTWKSGPGLYEPEFGDLMALTEGSLQSMISLLEDPEGQYKRYQAQEMDEDKDRPNTDVDQEEINEDENETKHESWNGTPKRNFWKELITHEPKETKKISKEKKKKNSKEKKPPHSSGLPTGGEKEDKRDGTERDGLLTFEEVFTKRFNMLRWQLVHCITGLYTHMPTSCLPFEVVNDMFSVLDMLKKNSKIADSY